MFSRKVPFTASTITGGFWKERYETVLNTTAQAVLDRYEETGRIKALDMTWQPGDPQQPHIFWESDVTKWMEGIAYFIAENDLPEWAEKLDELAETMARTQDENGYLNAYFTVVEPDKRFTRRVDHELYSAGHLIEAAVEYAKASGHTTLLNVAIRYADLIDETFRVRQSAAFDTCGHQEIEFALFKLYEYTGEERYKKLAEFFLDMRGKSRKDTTYDGYDDEHLQSHLPIREQKTAEGHAVRALYMFIAVADMALLNDDSELIILCRSFFQNIVDKRMYITGGVGSTHLGESFTFDYDLPSDTAYSETCASIALALFCRRLWLLDTNGLYADVAEQAIYNTVMGGLSLKGDSFFYENPLSADYERHAFYASRPERLTTHLPLLERAKMFNCSCCPPNLVRFVASVADFMYSVNENTIYTQLYMDADTSIELDNQTVHLEQRTAYPYDSTVDIRVQTAGTFRLALRIPSWCQAFTLSINGKTIHTHPASNFVFLDQGFEAGDRVRLEFSMPIRLISANPEVKELRGQVAVARGPIVYCAEAVDNLGINVHDIRIDPMSEFTTETIEIEGRSVLSLLTEAAVHQAEQNLYVAYPILEKHVTVRLVPYYTWANRGANNMTCWFRA